MIKKSIIEQIKFEESQENAIRLKKRKFLELERKDQ